MEIEGLEVSQTAMRDSQTVPAGCAPEIGSLKEQWSEAKSGRLQSQHCTVNASPNHDQVMPLRRETSWVAEYQASLSCREARQVRKVGTDVKYKQQN
jgi:hypothetical protein